jgi:hypothetical protein
LNPVQFALAAISGQKIPNESPSPRIDSHGSKERVAKLTHSASSRESPTPKPVPLSASRRRAGSPHPLAIPRSRVTPQYEPMPLELVATAQRFTRAHEIVAERPTYDRRTPPQPVDLAPSQLSPQAPSRALNQVPLRVSNWDGVRNRGEGAIDGSALITRRSNPHPKPGGQDYAYGRIPPEQRNPQPALGQSRPLKPKQGLDEPLRNGRVSLTSGYA